MTTKETNQSQIRTHHPRGQLKILKSRERMEKPTKKNIQSSIQSQISGQATNYKVPFSKVKRPYLAGNVADNISKKAKLTQMSKLKNQLMKKLSRLLGNSKTKNSQVMFQRHHLFLLQLMTMRDNLMKTSWRIKKMKIHRLNLTAPKN